MTSLSLIFPPPSPDYHDVIWSAKDAPSAPQTAPAELGAYVKAYANSPVQVQAINPQVIENGIIRYRTIDEIATFCQKTIVLYIKQPRNSNLYIERVFLKKNARKICSLQGNRVFIKSR